MGVTDRSPSPSRRGKAKDGDGEPRRRTSSPGGGTRSGARRELVEAELFDQALRLFAERGYAATSLQHIADAMGMSRPALYYYVDNKDELLARLVEETTQSGLVQLRTVAGQTTLSAVDRLRGMVHILADFNARYPARLRLLDRSEAELPPEVAQAHTAAKRAVRDELAAVIAEGIDQGLFHPVDERVTALALIGMCNWIAWWFHPGPEHPVAPVADQIAEMAVRAVLRGDGRRPAEAGPRAALDLIREDLTYLERLITAAE